MTDVEQPATQSDDKPSSDLRSKVSNTSASYNNSPVSEAITSSPVRVSSHGRVIKAPKRLIENSEL